MIESKKIIISTEKIIKNWKKGNYKLSPEFDKDNEQAFYVKDKGDYELSSVYEKKE